MKRVKNSNNTLIRIALIMAIALTASCAGGKKAAGGESGTFTDSRDGKIYKSVKIGKQTWMAENLKYEQKECKSPQCDKKTGECKPPKCTNIGKCGGTDKWLADENTEICDKYGRLYNWDAAMKVCPSGWHLPTAGEWEALGRNADPKYVANDNNSSINTGNIAGKMLKTKDGWNAYKDMSGNGEDKFGFAALPGGSGSSGGSFLIFEIGEKGWWWSATESRNTAYNFFMGNHADFLLRGDNNGKAHWFSVRCVKD